MKINKFIVNKLFLYYILNLILLILIMIYKDQII